MEKERMTVEKIIGMSWAQEVSNWHAPGHFPPHFIYLSRQVEEVWQKPPPPLHPFPIGTAQSPNGDLCDDLCMEVMSRKLI
jgi:hypothetical protein